MIFYPPLVDFIRDILVPGGLLIVTLIALLACILNDYGKDV